MRNFCAKQKSGLFFGLTILISLFSVCEAHGQEQVKQRILISSDIGGTDPDDFQSIIHLLMYADLFQIEGLISSPYGKGRKEDLLHMIDLYEIDLSKLKVHSNSFSATDSLRKVCKQGSKYLAPFKGFSTATEGSEWIIKCAKKPSTQVLWVLVWGGLEDLAQALHDAPEIKNNIRVYWIGGPNKKWSVNAYAYIAENHPDLWMIEANASYRGWFIDSESPAQLSNMNFYSNYIREQGAMGKAFKSYYDGIIKMGDTPSLVYLMNGDPENPSTDSWGGSFSRIDRSSRIIFERNTTNLDTVAAYATLEWIFKGPEFDISTDSACFTLEISNQIWPGYYLGKGIYGVRYSSKKPEMCTYVTASLIPELDGHTGQFVSTTPWPGEPNAEDYPVGPNWYSDRPEPEFFLGVQQGAKTVACHREEFLMDWAQRWEWLK